MRVIDIRCRYLTEQSLQYFDHGMRLKAHASPQEFFSWLAAKDVHTVLSPTAANLGLDLGRWDLPPRQVNNDEQAAMQRDYQNRFIGVAGIDPGNVIHDALEELERCVHELDLRIATIEPGRKPLLAPNPADRRLYDFYALAMELEVPVIIQTSGLKGGVTIDYAHPRWIDQVAHDFPDLNIICAHGCVPYFRELLYVLKRRPNVYASPDCYTFGDFSTISSYPEKQLIFASAYPFGSVSSLLEQYMTAHWKRKWLDDILYRNAIRALKLDRNPLFSSWLDSSPIYGLQTRTAFYLKRLRWRYQAKIGRVFQGEV